MIKIKPFRGYLPNKNLGEKVSTRPINSYSEEEIQAILESNKESFLNIILHDEKDKKMKTSERFEKTKSLFEDSIQKKHYIQSEEACFYIYKQTHDSHEYTGIIAGADTKNYRDGEIKKHELTLSKREKLFTKYLNITGFNAEPVLLVYPKNEKLSELITQITEEEKAHDFVSDDGLRHELWEVKDKNHITFIETRFSEIPSVYIADGHHRTASSNRLSLEHTHNENSQYVMSLLMNDENVHIYDFNRVLKNTHNLSQEKIKELLSHKFEILEESPTLLSPLKKHEFTLYFDSCWVRIRLKEEFLDKSGITQQLDSQIITDLILSPIFEIEELTKDKRVGFVPGNKGLDSLQKEVDNGKYDVAIAMFPVSFEELKLIADNQLIMPPKSTYIEPKLRSGLTVYKF